MSTEYFDLIITLGRNDVNADLFRQRVVAQFCNQCSRLLVFQISQQNSGSLLNPRADQSDGGLHVGGSELDGNVLPSSLLRLRWNSLPKIRECRRYENDFVGQDLIEVIHEIVLGSLNSLSIKDRLQLLFIS